MIQIYRFLFLPITLNVFWTPYAELLPRMHFVLTVGPAQSASLLGISSTQVVQDNVVLGRLDSTLRYLLLMLSDEATSNRSESSSQTSFLPYAILDHIVLDYRFKASKLTEPHHDSQSQDLLLPLRELLDYVLQRLVSIHLIGCAKYHRICPNC